MRRVRGGAAVAAAVVAMSGLSGCDPIQQPWRSELISVGAAGTAAGQGRSEDPVFSPDGSKIAFESSAPDLVENDTNGAPDVFVRDLVTGTTTLVSANAAGTDSGNRYSEQPVFSPDGTKIAFTSYADDLGPTDSKRFPPGFPDLEPLFAGDVYVRDLASGTTSLVSVNAAETDSANFLSNNPVFSPDGTNIAFTSWATDLGPHDSDDLVDDFLFGSDVYVRDMVGGTTSMVSVNGTGTDSGLGASSLPDFSPDGTNVAFSSTANDLGPTDSTRGGRDVDSDLFVRDLVSGTTSLVTVNAAGTDSAAEPTSFARVDFSPDSSQLVFESFAPDLVATDTNRATDIFLYDLASGTNSLVSVNAAGTDSANGASRNPAFSPDGGRVAFDTDAYDLGPPDGPPSSGGYDVYLRDLAAGETSLVSVRTNGRGGTAYGNSAIAPVWSPDGNKILFTGDARDLGPRDDRFSNDLFVRDFATATTTMVSTNAEGTGSGRGGGFYSWSPDGRSVVFTSTGSSFGPEDTNNDEDVYLATLRGADLRVTATAAPQGERLVYTVTVTNDGPDDAEDVVLGIVLPEGTSDVDSTCTAVDGSRWILCPAVDLPVSGSTLLEVGVRVDAPPGSALTAFAGVVSSTVDPAYNSNQVVVESPVSRR